MRKVEYQDLDKQVKGEDYMCEGYFHEWQKKNGKTYAIIERKDGTMILCDQFEFRFIEPEKVKSNDNHKKNQLEKLWDKNVFDEHVEKGEPYYIGCLLPFESHIPNILNSLRYGKLTPIKYAIPKSHYMIVQVTGKYDGVMGIDTFYDIKNYEESASKLTFIDCD